MALVGDSTVNDEGGWGPGFAASFDAKVKTMNFAKNGRSSKKLSRGRTLGPVLAAKPAWVLIQFGHNDCPGKGPDRETDPQTTFRANMIRYVAEARAVGTSPILVTSIVRRNFESNGTIKRDCLVPYVEEVRKIASEKSVPLIDLYALTLAQAERLGPAKTASLNAVKPDGSSDTTHLGRIGQREIGAIAAREFVRIVPSLRPSFHRTAGTAGISEIFRGRECVHPSGDNTLATATENVSNVLNNLIETCKDGEQGFKQAAEKAKDPSLRTLFSKYSRQRAGYVQELQQLVAARSAKNRRRRAMLRQLFIAAGLG